jgi:glucosyl-dolichyl phosphate glucuronosyltransferase
MALIVRLLRTGPSRGVPPRMELSVIICTYNRAETLSRTLTCLSRCERPPKNRWELIVMDNGGADCTRQALLPFRRELPIVYAREDRRGKYHALNSAVRMARSDLLVFLDDDVLPDPRLLNEYLQASVRYPDAHLFGGPVQLELPEGHDPDLVALPQARAVLAQSDFGTEARLLSYPEYPIGGNMAARRRAMGIDLYFEPIPQAGFEMELALEDCLFFKRAMLKGHRVLYLPRAAVRHIIRPEQVGMRYFTERYAHALIGQEILDEVKGCTRWFNVPRYHFRRLAARVVTLITNVTRSRRDRLAAYINVRAALRVIRHYRKQQALGH